MEKIKFREISTETAEQNFVKIIMEKSGEEKAKFFQTFFLNGVWGSGKTTFLDKVKKQTNNVKFIELKLWEIKDERTVTAIAFRNLHPYLNFIMQSFILSAIVISILMTPAINLGLSSFFNNYFIIFGTIIALIAAVYQVLKVKSDSMYRFLLPLFLNKKVLIIDDFDRVDVERQNEAYKLFNLLHGKLPIVFIGDYQKISKSNEGDGKFLQKIIDRRLELPSVLNAKNIWKEFIEEVDLKLNLSNSRYNPVIYSIIKSENRTMRELKQFEALLNYEVFERGKKELVDLEQLVTVVYIFLFYPQYYSELKDLGRLILPEGVLDSEKNVKWKFNEILTGGSKKVYPRKYSENKAIYYVDEFVNNLSLKEMKEIFSNVSKLRKIIRYDGDTDFLAYLVYEYSKFEKPRMNDFRNEEDEELRFFEQNRTLLEGVVFEEIKKGNRNQITDFIINELGRRLYQESKSEVEGLPEYQEILKGIGQRNIFQKDELDKQINKIESNKWEKYTCILSLSERIKFHIDFHFDEEYILSLLTEKSKEVIHNQQELTSEKYKHYIYYLLTRTFDEYLKNNDNVKTLIEDLPDNEFIQYWELMSLVVGQTIHTDSFDFSTGVRKNYPEIYEQNKERLDQIAASEGFKFKVEKRYI